jgi:mevalonate pyrophosphate decarboxylase
VMYCAPGFEDMPFTRPASEFFDGRFKSFVPATSFTEGYFDSNGRAQFGDTTTEEAEEDHEHFVDGKPKVVYGKN